MYDPAITLPPGPLPPGHRYQISKESFYFDIIKETQGFKRYQTYAQRLGLVRDICNPALNDVQTLPINDYIHIEQKSPTWFRFREMADATASSVGKKIKGSTMYPTMEQVSESWHDALSHKPFEMTHTMAGHMKWGVGYEDPALIHFAIDNNLAVVQVGTIHLPLDYVMKLIECSFEDSETQELTPHREYLQLIVSSSAHLLVSPDGVVGRPDKGEYGDMPTEIIGMLEIKCISPFHYMEEDADKTLTWVDDMQTRQWYSAGQIPYVYITQICLQAISGLHRLDMTMDDTMWFIRWSPQGFSEFKISFGPLVRMGIVAIMLYFRLKHRMTLDTLPLVYTNEEQQLANCLHREYSNVIKLMTHRYIDHSRLYPEFNIYRKCTELHRFIVKPTS